MKVKAFFFAALLLVGVTAANAQSKGELRIGVTAGMNVSNISHQETDSRIGFNLGLRGEYNFSDNVYATLGLLFTQKGSRTETEGSALSLTAKGTLVQNPGYLEIPLHFGYRYNVGSGISIFGETGPYFAFGVCGKTKFDVDSNVGLSGNYDYDFFKEDGSDAKAFDAGWGLRAGVEVSGFQISLGYEHGFVSLWDGSDNYMNSNFMVGVSYMF